MACDFQRRRKALGERCKNVKGFWRDQENRSQIQQTLFVDDVLKEFEKIDLFMQMLKSEFVVDV